MFFPPRIRVLRLVEFDSGLGMAKALSSCSIVKYLAIGVSIPRIGLRIGDHVR